MNEIHIKSDAKYIDVHHNDVVNVDISTKESASEDLEDVSKKYSSCIYLEEVLSDDDKEVLKKRLVNTFKAGANWQKEQDTRDMLKSDNTEFFKCYEKGKSDMKQQMMKNAVEVRIVNCANAASESLSICGQYFSCIGSFREDMYCPTVGDKVKLIIIKED